MFEALLVSEFLPAKRSQPLLGLKAKLDALSQAGYAVSRAQSQELLAWAKLRNLFSHMPPEHFRPIAVDREDVQEFVSLLKSVCETLSEQRSRTA